MLGFKSWLYENDIVCFMLKGLKTYPHADAKQRKTLFWPKLFFLYRSKKLMNVFCGLIPEYRLIPGSD
jgi:hypothetical protein